MDGGLVRTLLKLRSHRETWAWPLAMNAMLRLLGAKSGFKTIQHHIYPFTLPLLEVIQYNLTFTKTREMSTVGLVSLLIVWFIWMHQPSLLCDYSNMKAVKPERFLHTRNQLALIWLRWLHLISAVSELSLYVYTWRLNCNNITKYWQTYSWEKDRLWLFDMLFVAYHILDV